MIKQNINRFARKAAYITKRCRKLLLEPVLGYTRIVFATKYILSFIAVILILALILLPLFNPLHENFRITFSNVEGLTGGKDPKMVNPRFQGVDQEDQTYNITADYAIKKDDETLALDNINADINLKDDSWIALASKHGVFNHAKQIIAFSNSVNIFTSNGYEFYTKSFSANVGKQTAKGTHKIHGHGPVGTLTADGFEIKNSGDHIIFKGNVRLTLHPEKVQKSDTQ